MQWTYDAAVDALTILLLPGRRSARTDELGMGMFCDYDRMGHPVAIEILDASTHFPARTLRALPLPQVMVPLSEASRTAGLDPSKWSSQFSPLDVDESLASVIDLDLPSAEEVTPDDPPVRSEQKSEHQLKRRREHARPNREPAPANLSANPPHVRLEFPEPGIEILPPANRRSPSTSVAP